MKDLLSFALLTILFAACGEKMPVSTPTEPAPLQSQHHNCQLEIQPTTPVEFAALEGFRAARECHLSEEELLLQLDGLD